MVREKWDEMSWFEMVLARQVPEPEWYPAGLFDACVSRSPKQNVSNQDKTPVIYILSGILTVEAMVHFAMKEIS